MRKQPADESVHPACKEVRPYGPDCTLLGETGSGKEMFAQSMHNASSRRNGPFVAVTVRLFRGILESELFGYDDGAFTGARRSGKDWGSLSWLTMDHFPR